VNLETWINKVEDLKIGGTYELSGIAIFGNIVDSTKVELFGTFPRVYSVVGGYNEPAKTAIKKIYRFLMLNQLPIHEIYGSIEQEEMQELLDKKLLKIKEGVKP
jgi:hypothetical protein